MTITILKKEHTRLRVKEVPFKPMDSDSVLLSDIDVMNLPESHMGCPKCKCYKFEVWIITGSSRIEIGCIECGWCGRLLFPQDITFPAKSGRFSCTRHPTKGFIIIHNIDTLSIGCELCVTEIDFKLRKTNNLVVAQ